MKQPQILLGGALVIITLAADSLVRVHDAKAQTLLPARFSYAAKFVCGSQATTAESPPAEPPVQPGNYSTVINLHNPSATTVSIQKKIVRARDFSENGTHCSDEALPGQSAVGSRDVDRLYGDRESIETERNCSDSLFHRRMAGG